MNHNLVDAALGILRSAVHERPSNLEMVKKAADLLRKIVEKDIGDRKVKVDDSNVSKPVAGQVGSDEIKVRNLLRKIIVG
jgi:hypothetical protein